MSHRSTTCWKRQTSDSLMPLMRFIFGPIPPSRVSTPRDEGWTALREPSAGIFIIQVLLLSVPFLVAALAILLGLKGFLRAHPLALAALVTFFAIMIPLHETMHAVVYPGGLRSRHLVMGAWLRRGLCYVVYDTPVSRNRILMMLATPFIAMSLLLAVATALAPSELRMVGILAILVHTAVCTGDFATMLRLIRQVPKTALVLNDGWTTFWKSAHHLEPATQVEK